MIGAIVFGYMSFLFAYGAIVAFHGKQAADEFMECLAAIFGFVMGEKLISQYIIEKVVMEFVLPYVQVELSFWLGWKIGSCIRETFWE